MPDGRVEFEITADNRKAYQSIEQVTADLKKEGNKWEKNAAQSTDAIGESFVTMLKRIGGAIGAAKIGKALLDIGKDAVRAASDLQEVQNVVDVTFGEAGAAKIEAWAKRAGDQFGLTETQAKKFTSTLGAMMKSAGLTGDEIVSMSTDMAGLAADMASFYNLDFDTAFQKIRSGISGETEPLKQLGINMSVANLNAFALQKGLAKTFEQMTQGEQTMLRYQYLMQATSDAQGDFARTSDGYANSLRALETNLESMKTNLGEILLPTISDIVSLINSVFESEEEWSRRRTVLDDIADIDAKTQTALENVNAAKTHVDELTKVLQEIGVDDETTALLALGTNSEEALKGLDALGLSTEEIEAKQSAWLATCKELVDTMPGLSGIIDTQTGEIRGGIPAIREYADEWARMASYQAQVEGLRQKQELLTGLPTQAELEANARNARAAAVAMLKTYEGLSDEQAQNVIAGGKYLANYSYTGQNAEGIGQIGYNQLADNAFLSYQQFYGGEAFGGGMALEISDKSIKAIQDYVEAEYSHLEFLETQPALQAAYEAELQRLAEEYGVTTEELEAQIEAERKAAEQTEKIKTSVQEAADAFKAVNDYYAQIRTQTASDVNSSINGFTFMKTAAEQAKEAANAYQTFEESLKKAGKSGRELEIALNDANKQITAQNMKTALDSQLAFINEYKKNLEDVKNTGLIDENIIAQLSDGSNESAQYLHAMAEAARSGDTAALTELNAAWKAVNEGKETFVDTLTQQKLAVDEKYDAMVSKAEEAAKALDVSAIAGESTGNNIQAMADAIKAHIPGVAEQVDALLAELNRLNEWGVTIDYGFGASTVINPHAIRGKGQTIGEYEVGLNYVPFDGFLASLHEGEGVLTAEENRIWQRFRNGQPGMDYETLGGVMRENVKPGGNVYLDGRVVGSVVSQMQGNQYRTMQRSGWQQ